MSDDTVRDVMRDAAGAAERRDELVRVALTTGDTLDDIRRSKIWTRIEDRLDDRAHTPWRWVLAGGAGALAIAAAVMLLVAHGHSVDGFVAPADATLSLQLGHAKAALVGPARLDVLEATENTTTVALKSGRLLGELQGGHGRALTIEAPGARIEIVGTLFAVDVSGATTCVSVAHGRVKMTTFTRVLFVDGGARACSDSARSEAIATDVQRALAHHAATLALAESAPARDPAPSSPPAPERRPMAAPIAAPVPVPVPASLPAPASVPSASHAPSPKHPAPLPGAHGAPVSPPPATTSVSEAPLPPIAENAPPPAPSPLAPPPRAAPVPVPPPAVVAKPPPRPPSADELYRSAEAALAKRDVATADRILATIVDTLPTSSLVDQALYERARIAYDRHAYADAQRHLARLATLPTSPLLEPGAYLGCRVAIAANASTSDACLATYRATYPHSPHDLDVLGLLVDRAFRAGGCTRAAPLVDELSRLYQATTLARGWRERCP